MYSIMNNYSAAAQPGGTPPMPGSAAQRLQPAHNTMYNAMYTTTGDFSGRFPLAGGSVGALPSRARSASPSAQQAAHARTLSKELLASAASPSSTDTSKLCSPAAARKTSHHSGSSSMASEYGAALDDVGDRLQVAMRHLTEHMTMLGHMQGVANKGRASFEDRSISSSPCHPARYSAASPTSCASSARSSPRRSHCAASPTSRAFSAHSCRHSSHRAASPTSRASSAFSYPHRSHRAALSTSCASSGRSTPCCSYHGPPSDLVSHSSIPRHAHIHSHATPPSFLSTASLPRNVFPSHSSSVLLYSCPSTDLPPPARHCSSSLPPSPNGPAPTSVLSNSPSFQIPSISTSIDAWRDHPAAGKLPPAGMDSQGSAATHLPWADMDRQDSGAIGSKACGYPTRTSAATSFWAGCPSARSPLPVSDSPYGMATTVRHLSASNPTRRHRGPPRPTASSLSHRQLSSTPRARGDLGPFQPYAHQTVPTSSTQTTDAVPSPAQFLGLSASPQVLQMNPSSHTVPSSPSSRSSAPATAQDASPNQQVYQAAPNQQAYQAAQNQQVYPSSGAPSYCQATVVPTLNPLNMVSLRSRYITPPSSDRPTTATTTAVTGAPAPSSMDSPWSFATLVRTEPSSRSSSPSYRQTQTNHGAPLPGTPHLQQGMYHQPVSQPPQQPCHSQQQSQQPSSYSQQQSPHSQQHPFHSLASESFTQPTWPGAAAPNAPQSASSPSSARDPALKAVSAACSSAACSSAAVTSAAASSATSSAASPHWHPALGEARPIEAWLASPTASQHTTPFSHSATPHPNTPIQGPLQAKFTTHHPLTLGSTDDSYINHSRRLLQDHSIQRGIDISKAWLLGHHGVTLDSPSALNSNSTPSDVASNWSEPAMQLSIDAPNAPHPFHCSTSRTCNMSLYSISPCHTAPHSAVTTSTSVSSQLNTEAARKQSHKFSPCPPRPVASPAVAMPTAHPPTLAGGAETAGANEPWDGLFDPARVLQHKIHVGPGTQAHQANQAIKPISAPRPKGTAVCSWGHLVSSTIYAANGLGNTAASGWHGWPTESSSTYNGGIAGGGCGDPAAPSNTTTTRDASQPDTRLWEGMGSMTLVDNRLAQHSTELASPGRSSAEQLMDKPGNGMRLQYNQPTYHNKAWTVDEALPMTLYDNSLFDAEKTYCSVSSTPQPTYSPRRWKHGNTNINPLFEVDTGQEGPVTTGLNPLFEPMPDELSPTLWASSLYPYTSGKAYGEPGPAPPTAASHQYTRHPSPFSRSTPALFPTHSGSAVANPSYGSSTPADTSVFTQLTQHTHSLKCLENKLEMLLQQQEEQAAQRAVLQRLGHQYMTLLQQHMQLQQHVAPGGSRVPTGLSARSSGRYQPGIVLAARQGTGTLPPSELDGGCAGSGTAATAAGSSRSAPLGGDPTLSTYPAAGAYPAAGTYSAGTYPEAGTCPAGTYPEAGTYSAAGSTVPGAQEQSKFLHHGGMPAGDTHFSSGDAHQRTSQDPAQPFRPSCRKLSNQKATRLNTGSSSEEDPHMAHGGPHRKAPPNTAVDGILSIGASGGHQQQLLAAGPWLVAVPPKHSASPRDAASPKPSAPSKPAASPKHAASARLASSPPKTDSPKPAASTMHANKPWVASTIHISASPMQANSITSRKHAVISPKHAVISPKHEGHDNHHSCHYDNGSCSNSLNGSLAFSVPRDWPQAHLGRMYGTDSLSSSFFSSGNDEAQNSLLGSAFHQRTLVASSSNRQLWHDNNAKSRARTKSSGGTAECGSTPTAPGGPSEAVVPPATTGATTAATSATTAAISTAGKLASGQRQDLSQASTALSTPSSAPTGPSPSVTSQQAYPQASQPLQRSREAAAATTATQAGRANIVECAAVLPNKLNTEQLELERTAFATSTMITVMDHKTLLQAAAQTSNLSTLPGVAPVLPSWPAHRGPGRVQAGSGSAAGTKQPPTRGPASNPAAPPSTASRTITATTASTSRAQGTPAFTKNINTANASKAAGTMASTPKASITHANTINATTSADDAAKKRPLEAKVTFLRRISSLFTNGKKAASTHKARDPVGLRPRAVF